MVTSKWGFVVAALAVTPLTGCMSEAQYQASQQAIVGGVTDNGDPGVVMISINANASGEGICTGEVVSPHVVLSAAHCVDKTLLNSPNPVFSIFLGSDYSNTIARTSPRYNIPVTSYKEDPAYNPNNVGIAGSDVSVLITTEAIPVDPIYMNREPLTMDYNATAPLRLVGYGVTSGVDGGSSEPAGIRRQVTTSMTQTELCTTGLTTCTNTETVNYFDDTFISLGTAEKGICHGDSGGPAFQTNQNGVEVIVGVTSFTIVTNAGECAQSYSDRIDKLTDFVDGVIASVGDPPNVTPASPAPVPDMAAGSSGSSGKGGCSTSNAGADGVALLMGLGALAVVRRRRRLS